MSLYNIALFIHIVGVVGTFMVAGVELTMVLRLRRAQTVEQVRTLLIGHTLIDKLYPVMGIFILLPGIYMALTRWGWIIAWINTSLLVLVLMGVLGSAINARRLNRVHSSIEGLANGPLSQDIVNTIHDPVLWTSVLTMDMVALGVIYLMTIKPGLLGTGIMVVVTLALGIVLGRVGQRPRVTSASERAEARVG